VYVVCKRLKLKSSNVKLVNLQSFTVMNNVYIMIFINLISVPIQVVKNYVRNERVVKQSIDYII